MTISELVGRVYYIFQKSQNRIPSNREAWAFICSAYTMNSAEYQELCERLGVQEKNIKV